MHGTHFDVYEGGSCIGQGKQRGIAKPASIKSVLCNINCDVSVNVVLRLEYRTASTQLAVLLQKTICRIRLNPPVQIYNTLLHSAGRTQGAF